MAAMIGATSARAAGGPEQQVTGTSLSTSVLNNPSNKVAEIFTAVGTGILHRITVDVQKTGTPGDLKVEVVNTANGSPATGAARANTTVSASAVSTSMSTIQFDFVYPAAAYSGTSYALVFTTTSADVSNYYSFATETSGVNGSHLFTYAGSWVSSTDSLRFGDFVQAFAPATTLPANNKMLAFPCDSTAGTKTFIDLSSNGTLTPNTNSPEASSKCYSGGAYNPITNKFVVVDGNSSWSKLYEISPVSGATEAELTFYLSNALSTVTIDSVAIDQYGYMYIFRRNNSVYYAQPRGAANQYDLILLASGLPRSGLASGFNPVDGNLYSLMDSQAGGPSQLFFLTLTRNGQNIPTSASVSYAMMAPMCLSTCYSLNFDSSGVGWLTNSFEASPGVWVTDMYSMTSAVGSATYSFQGRLGAGAGYSDSLLIYPATIPLMTVPAAPSPTPTPSSPTSTPTPTSSASGASTSSGSRNSSSLAETGNPAILNEVLFWLAFSSLLWGVMIYLRRSRFV
ncbi:hypothetical protein [Aurantimicrobium minutum]|uniref:hypothetical protein n=1 Tax=Aurantimicrobium minutum TaxID=708131 RepID=UPI00247417B1|nr:hypothetical protein [Aurantimicrobium minutum]